MASVVISRPGTDDLRRIDNAGLEHVLILFGLSIEAEGLRLVVSDPPDHDRALDARVLGDLTDRSLECLQDDVDAGLDLRVFVLEFRHGLLGAEQYHAATWDDPFLDCRAGGMEGIIDPVLLLLDLDLGGAADADHGDAAGELR